MKKIITAINNKELLKKINNEKEIKNMCNNLQYREAILEILEKNKKIDYIIISENILGQISIEELIIKIKKINNKINIIFLLEKEDNQKKEKLKKLGIKNIYADKKINSNDILNIILKKELKNKMQNKQINKNIENKNNKIISIYGDEKSGKTSITNLIIINLVNKNKKILLININKKIEKNYLNLIGKNYYKIKKSNNKKIKINSNIYFDNELNRGLKNNKQDVKSFLQKHIYNYDYILIDVGTKKDTIKKDILQNSDIRINIVNKQTSNIKLIKKLLIQYKNENIKKDYIMCIENYKYVFNSISYSIIKEILKNYNNIYNIHLYKYYNNLYKKIIDGKMVKDINTKKIEKIIQE